MKRLSSKTVDVVVVGYGLAGVVAAITAHDEGAETIILEKQSENNFWTSSSASGGIFINVSDIDDAVKYLDGLYKINDNLYWTERDVIRVWAEYAAENKTWLERLGAKIKVLGVGGQHTELPGALSITMYQFAGSGLGMMRFFYDQVKLRKIEVFHNSPAKRLILNNQNEVIGVELESEQDGVTEKKCYFANKAVVLACGGFEHNEIMKLQYLGIHPIYFPASPGNTGDGIRMATAVGAELWHMSCVSGILGAKFPDFPYPFFLEYGGRGWIKRTLSHDAHPTVSGFIIVDKYGRRFTNENLKLHCTYYELTTFDAQHIDYPRIPCYFIFDQKRLAAGPLAAQIGGVTGPLQIYKWSRDNSAEVTKGWIISANNIRELAQRLGMRPETLEATLARYNKNTESGYDADFQRKSSDLVALNTPPFHAIRLWPVGANTQGGPKRNRRAQIVNTDGLPIRGLYGAGELGSIYGKLYPQGGGNLAECIAFGRIAGENAAREKRRGVRRHS